jgi:hypothetical protein
LFGKLLFDFSRKRFGEDSSRTGRPEAAALGRSGATSAIYRAKSQRSPPVALVNKFGTRRSRCASWFAAGKRATTAANGLPVLGATGLHFHRVLSLTQT